MWKTHAKLLASAVFWGGTWISGRNLAQAWGRFRPPFCASRGLGLSFPAVPRVHGRFSPPARRDLPGLALLGLTGVFGYNAFFFAGLRTVTAGRAALIVAAIPAVVSLYSGLALRERFGAARICGIVLSFCGAGVVLSGGEPLALFYGGFSPGDLAILGCVACWAAYTLAGGR
jgi:drug/metabolite transporter (DMT)-like permease